MPLNNFLKTMDRYVRQVPIKGSSVWFRPKVIIVTANIHPSKWYQFKPTELYPDGRVDKEVALRRRFTQVFSFDRSKNSFIHYTKEEDIADFYWPIDFQTVDIQLDGANILSFERPPPQPPTIQMYPYFQDTLDQCINRLNKKKPQDIFPQAPKPSYKKICSCPIDYGIDCHSCFLKTNGYTSDNLEIM